MLQPFHKSSLSYQEQVQRLRKNGMSVMKQNDAIKILSTISYYRLSGYWYPFRERDSKHQVLDSFEPNSRFETAVMLYEFDRKLRNSVLAAIERIEVAIRTQFTYHLAHTYGAFGYAQAANFHPKFKHADWLNKLESEVERSQDTFIKHYKNKYQGYPQVPIWMLTEVMSLGCLSRGYQGLRNDRGQGVEDKKAISDFFDLHPKRLEEWLHIFTYVRNICAHHSRLWNRELAIHPRQVKEPKWSPPTTPRSDRIFYALLMICYMLNRIGDATEWVTQINALLEPVCKTKRWQEAMGVPPNWQKHPLWCGGL